MPATVLMRTPGQDEDLVRGFLFHEGMIGGLADVVAIRRPPDLPEGERGNVVDVEIAASRSVAIGTRLFYSSSSCGVCGKNSIAALEIKAEPIASQATVRRSILATLPARMRAAQPAYRETGGVHAAGLFEPDGKLVAVREDVGRHNALDKLVGWALGHGLVPLDNHILLVSGRVSYEILQKAIVARVPIVAAVGAPSSLALALATRFGLTLAGFVRDDSMNVYANAQRILEA
jgi:FdhD protein